MNKPKYKIGDRFSVMGVEYEIIYVVEATKPTYLFQNCSKTSLKSTVTETELNAIYRNSNTKKQ